MGRVGVILMILLAPFVLKAQDLEGNYNPFVSSGVIQPSPLLPVENNGTGTISFIIGNGGTDPLEVFSGGMHMTITISLSYGEPDHSDPLAAVGGNASVYFTWNYDPGSLTYTGTQVSSLFAGSSDIISIAYRVTQNSHSNGFNGFNVNIQPAPYHQNSNNSADDAVNSYTYTDADTTGVNVNRKSGIVVYPNPGSLFYLDLKGSFSDRIEVINYHGTIVKEIIPNQGMSLIPIDLEHLPPGSYLLRIYTKQNIITKGIVILH